MTAVQIKNKMKLQQKFPNVRLKETCTLHHTAPYCTSYSTTLHIIQHHTAQHTAPYCTSYSTTLHIIQHHTAHHTAPHCTSYSTILHIIQHHTAHHTAPYCTATNGIPQDKNRTSFTSFHFI